MEVYFDNTATTPLDPEVFEAMIPYMQKDFGNPSAIHKNGRKNRVAIEESRKTVAALLGAKPSDIFFTSGGTESSNTVINAAVHDLKVKRIICSRIEHHCVLYPAQKMQKQWGIETEYVALQDSGEINYEHLEKLLASEKKNTLVSLMHANNEIGVMNDLEKIGLLCNKYKAYFLSDTVQTIGHFPFDLSNLPIHFITSSAHKFHGPFGIGFLYIHPELKISPYFLGGAQERNMRAGTENVYGIVGLTKALEIACRDLDKDREKITALRKYMIDALLNNFEDIRFNSPLEEPFLYTVLNVSFPPSKLGDILIYNLDIEGIAASAGSACSSGSNVGSHVMNALGKDPARTGIRFSFSKLNTFDEVDYVIATLKKLLLH